jgi:hypothetical protein
MMNWVTEHQTLLLFGKHNVNFLVLQEGVYSTFFEKRKTIHIVCTQLKILVFTNSIVMMIIGDNQSRRVVTTIPVIKPANVLLINRSTYFFSFSPTAFLMVSDSC